jgi:hypothetical protein
MLAEYYAQITILLSLLIGHYCKHTLALVNFSNAISANEKPLHN